jgi:hypothetical protein
MTSWHLMIFFQSRGKGKVLVTSRSFLSVQANSTLQIKQLKGGDAHKKKFPGAPHQSACNLIGRGVDRTLQRGEITVKVSKVPTVNHFARK